MKTMNYFSRKLLVNCIAIFYFLFLSAFSVSALNITTTVINRVGVWPDVVGTATNTIGDYVEVSFDGTGIIWEGVKWDNAGMVEMMIDGVVVDKLDMFGAIWERVIWERSGLEAGFHTLRITVIDEKNPSSPDNWVNLFGRFVVIEPLVALEGDGWSSKRDGWGGLGLPSTGVVGDYIEVPFQGTGIKFNHLLFGDGGIAQATIDGEDAGEIDFYGVNNTSATWTKEGLEDKKHVLRITVLDKSNPEAIGPDGYFMNYLGFESIGTTIAESGIDWDVDPMNNSFVTSVREASVDVTFEGSSIRWISVGTDYSGIATVSIDGGAPQEVNQYREGVNVPIIWEKTGLSAGTHTLHIAMAENSPQDSFISYIRFEQVGRSEYGNSIDESELSAKKFCIADGKLVILDDAFNGQQLDICVYTLSGKTIYCADIVGNESIQLPKLNETSIIVVNNNGQRIFSEKYWAK